MNLERLRLKNFLSFREAELELGALTVLVGQNAAGKSNLIKALTLLREIPEGRLEHGLFRYGSIGALIHRGDGQDFEIEIDFSDRSLRLSVHEEGWIGPYRRDGDDWCRLHKDEAGAFEPLTALKVVSSDLVKIRSFQDIHSSPRLFDDGSNLASVWKTLDASARQEVESALAGIVPGVLGVTLAEAGEQLRLMFRMEGAGGKEMELTAGAMSDGTLKIFHLLVALTFASRRQSSMVIVEEPEEGVHLGALLALGEILKAHSETTQILLTTHSLELVDSFDVDQLRVVWFEDGESHVAPVAEHTRQVVRDGLMTPGELLKASALDPEMPAAVSS